MSRRWEGIQERFGALLELEPRERRAALAELDRTEPEVAAELRSLLQAHDEAEAGAFLGALDQGPAAELMARPVPQIPEPGDTVGRYRLQRQVGSGGMGVVYEARDPRLERRVALKLLPPWMTSDPEARRRFLREARAASALDHPNVATLFEAAETDDGRPYLVMAYCEGPTLAERIRTGPLPVDAAVRIGIDLAAGLDAAHRLGIVHRDVKPHNVVLTDAGPRLLDFGIARNLGEDLTRPGAVVGTLRYMSPEQARGEPVDARSDVWALGAVIYEMLTGTQPFDASNDGAVIYRILHADLTPVRELRPEVPAGVAEAVERCLERNPAERLASAEKLRAALAGEGEPRSRPPVARGVWIGVAAVALVALGLGFVLRGGTPSPVDGERSIAVVPFAAADTTDAVWARGIQDDLLTRLASIPALQVTSRRAAEAYRGADDPARTARELGVRWIVEGGVRTLEGEMRLNLRVVDPYTERQAWAGSWSRELSATGLVSLEEDAVTELTDWLRLDGAEAAGSGVGGSPGDLESYRRYVEARTLLDRRTNAGLQRAETELLALVTDAPTYAEAWAGLADALVLQALNGYADPLQALPRARNAAVRALELDAELAEAHASMGLVAMALDNDGPEALRRLRRAVELRPSFADARLRLGGVLVNTGRLSEAGEELRRAAALEPNAPANRISLARWYQYTDSIELALAEVGEALRLEPGLPTALLLQGELLLEQGRPAEAREVLEEALETPGVNTAAFPGIWVELALVHTALGDTARADQVFAEVEATLPSFVASSYQAGLGRPDSAMVLLEASPVLPPFTHILRYHPVFDPIRGDPRLETILLRYDSAWGIAPGQGR